MKHPIHRDIQAALDGLREALCSAPETTPDLTQCVLMALGDGVRAGAAVTILKEVRGWVEARSVHEITAAVGLTCNDIRWRALPAVRVVGELEIAELSFEVVIRDTFESFHVAAMWWFLASGDGSAADIQLDVLSDELTALDARLSASFGRRLVVRLLGDRRVLLGGKPSWTSKLAL